MSVEPEELRRTMRRWATGVTVVSVENNGIFHGMTVNSFTSVSIDPPLILVSLERGTRTQGMVSTAGYFGVTILHRRQQEIAERFAGRYTEHLNRFEGLDTFKLLTGAPLLAGGLAWFDCKVVVTYEAGTHTLYLGDVLAVKERNEDRPLIYYNQDYRGVDKR